MADHRHFDGVPIAIGTEEKSPQESKMDFLCPCSKEISPSGRNDVGVQSDRQVRSDISKSFRTDRRESEKSPIDKRRLLTPPVCQGMPGRFEVTDVLKVTTVLKVTESFETKKSTVFKRLYSLSDFK